MWSLFDPNRHPRLTDTFGEEFEKLYLEAEENGEYERQVKARDLYSRMMRTLAQTGNGWMTFKDTSNRTCNQAKVAGNVVHLSNLCTEILEVTNQAETAVCNLGSVNLGAMVRPLESGALAFDFDRLAEVVLTAVPYLDRVIDINFYPTDEAGNSNAKWRPVGLGMMGLQDVFFKCASPRPLRGGDDTAHPGAVYYHAVATPWSRRKTAARAYEDTGRRRQAPVRPHGITPTTEAGRVRREVARPACAPSRGDRADGDHRDNGCYECIEPWSRTFKRETLGDFLQINNYLPDLARGLDEEMRNASSGRGLDPGIEELPRTCACSTAPLGSCRRRRSTWWPPAALHRPEPGLILSWPPTIGKLSHVLYAWKQG